MAVQSQLFRGDPKLEAASVSDPAHIVPGAAGEHVRKIQQALIALDGATIAADGNYGPATAAAVLAYKRKRNIINPSYQTQADNIVGKMTMAALDREMLAKERGLPDLETVGLLSASLRGDPRLERTLRNDAQHVVPGDRGEFVSLIQNAVLTLEGGNIGPDELRAQLYGTQTAKAVLAYKTRRKIINPAIQTTPDNIVGKLTIRSLDLEMLAFEVQERLSASRNFSIKRRSQGDLP
ncbi:MAG: peptidoglycan-binding protein [Planctomycetia bacterium]|nr:peptidoglycan-binding protein [Planctomycetia bacterium]